MERAHGLGCSAASFSSLLMNGVCLTIYIIARLHCLKLRVDVAVPGCCGYISSGLPRWLQAAVQGAVLGRGPGDSHDAERLAANWFRGLLAGDQVPSCTLCPAHVSAL